MRGGNGRQPLPSVPVPLPKRTCDLCETGYARRRSQHDHRVLVRTPDGLLQLHGLSRTCSRIELRRRPCLSVVVAPRRARLTSRSGSRACQRLDNMLSTRNQMKGPPRWLVLRSGYP